MDRLERKIQLYFVCGGMLNYMLKDLHMVSEEQSRLIVSLPVKGLVKVMALLTKYEI